MRIVLIAAIAALCLSGCTRHIGRFGILAPPGTTTARGGGSVGMVRGEDKRPIWVVIPTGPPNAEVALSDALSKANARYLVNATVSYFYWYVPYVYGVEKIIIEGEARR